MTTDLFRTVRAEDGFAADPDDFNNAQRTGGARLFDQVLAKIVPNLTISLGDLDLLDKNGANIPAGPWAYALEGGGARPIQGSTNAKIKISAGTLLQKIAADDGIEAKLLAYTFPGTDEVTIANGDATNPRVDIVQMKLEYVDDTPTTRDFEDAATRAKTSPTTNIYHRVQCTLSVKQGAPAAGPTYPDPDAGFVAIAGVLVAATWTGATAFKLTDTAGVVAVLHDQRMPLGTRIANVQPADMNYTAATWALNATNRGSILASGTPDPVAIQCPIGGVSGRLIGINPTLKNVGTLLCAIAGYKMLDDGSGNALQVITSTHGAGINAGALARNPTNLALFEGLHSPSAGPGVSPSPGATYPSSPGLGVPIWTSGLRVPYIKGSFGAPEPFLAACLYIAGVAAGCIIGPCTFYVATGI